MPAFVNTRCYEFVFKPAVVAAAAAAANCTASRQARPEHICTEADLAGVGRGQERTDRLLLVNRWPPSTRVSAL